MTVTGISRFMMLPITKDSTICGACMQTVGKQDSYGERKKQKRMEDFIKDSTAMKIGVMLDDFSVRPTKAHEEDAGYDLYMPLNQFGICRGHGSMEVDTGVHMVIPRGYFGKVEAKSGLNMKHNLTTTGVVDAQYTGSIRVKLYNHGDKTIEFKGGDKIAQIVIHKLPEVELVDIDELPDTDRGQNGFGSSGSNIKDGEA